MPSEKSPERPFQRNLPEDSLEKSWNKEKYMVFMAFHVVAGSFIPQDLGQHSTYDKELGRTRYVRIII